jgi:hypothetical protein
MGGKWRVFGLGRFPSHLEPPSATDSSTGATMGKSSRATPKEYPPQEEEEEETEEEEEEEEEEEVAELLEEDSWGWGEQGIEYFERAR